MSPCSLTVPAGRRFSHRTWSILKRLRGGSLLWCSGTGRGQGVTGLGGVLPPFIQNWGFTIVLQDGEGQGGTKVLGVGGGSLFTHG